MTNKAKIRSSTFVTLAILFGSIGSGALYYNSMFTPLQERVSDDGYGYVLEKTNEPSPLEKEAGQRALDRWLFAPQNDRYKIAVDIVRGHALYGLDGAQIIERLGCATDTKSDSYKRLKYHAEDKDHKMCDMYVTFDSQHFPKVIYSAIFISGNSKDK